MCIHRWWPAVPTMNLEGEMEETYPDDGATTSCVLHGKNKAFSPIFNQIIKKSKKFHTIS